MTNINSVSGQRTISDIEKYIFDSIFQSNDENKIAQIIESNETFQITRKWIFNEKGQLSKECDWRESEFSSSFGYSSTTNYKEYIYQYHLDGKINQIVETKVENGDTLETFHNFDYSTNNEMKESFRIKEHELIGLEFIILTKFKNGLPDSITHLYISHIGKGFVESKTIEIFKYNEKNILTDKTNYFSVNSFPVEEDKEPESEVLGSKSKFCYDDLGRIRKIIDHEFDKNEKSKLNRKVQFEYEGDDSKITKVNMILGESYTPRELEYKMEYDDNGTIKLLKINGDTFYFKIEEKK